jgi:hypothetical protein
MQPSIETVRSNATDEFRLVTRISWAADRFQVRRSAHFHWQGLAWSLFFSAILWVGFILAGRELWSLRR